MSEIPPQLILVLTASYAGAIGYAELFDCQVRKQIVGTFEEKKITLSILAGDKNKIDFLSSHLYPKEIELGFTMLRKGEPYSVAPISGFVDKEKTSWEIKYLREAH